MNSTDKQEMTLFLVSPSEYHSNGWDFNTKDLTDVSSYIPYFFFPPYHLINASPIGLIKWLGY